MGPLFALFTHFSGYSSGREENLKRRICMIYGARIQQVKLGEIDQCALLPFLKGISERPWLIGGREPRLSVYLAVTDGEL